MDDDDQVNYQLVGTQEADLDAGKITRVSPLGKALLGHHPGETVTIQAPNANYQVQLIAVTLHQPE